MSLSQIRRSPPERAACRATWSSVSTGSRVGNGTTADVDLAGSFEQVVRVDREAVADVLAVQQVPVDIGERSHRQLEVELAARIRPGERPVPVERGASLPARRASTARSNESGGIEQIEILVRAEVRLKGRGARRAPGPSRRGTGRRLRPSARTHEVEVGQHAEVGGRSRRVRAREGCDGLVAHVQRRTFGRRRQGRGRHDASRRAVRAGRARRRRTGRAPVDGRPPGGRRRRRRAPIPRACRLFMRYLASSSWDPLPGGGPTSTRSTSTQACASSSRASWGRPITSSAGSPCARRSRNRTSALTRHLGRRGPMWSVPWTIRERRRASTRGESVAGRWLRSSRPPSAAGSRRNRQWTSRNVPPILAARRAFVANGSGTRATHRLRHPLELPDDRVEHVVSHGPVKVPDRNARRELRHPVEASGAILVRRGAEGQGPKVGDRLLGGNPFQARVPAVRPLGGARSRRRGLDRRCLGARVRSPDGRAHRSGGHGRRGPPWVDRDLVEPGASPVPGLRRRLRRRGGGTSSPRSGGDSRPPPARRPGWSCRNGRARRPRSSAHRSRRSPRGGSDLRGRGSTRPWGCPRAVPHGAAGRHRGGSRSSRRSGRRGRTPCPRPTDASRWSHGTTAP